jgi:hypothetical protein
MQVFSFGSANTPKFGTDANHINPGDISTQMGAKRPFPYNSIFMKQFEGPIRHSAHSQKWNIELNCITVQATQVPHGYLLQCMRIYTTSQNQTVMGLCEVQALGRYLYILACKYLCTKLNRHCFGPVLTVRLTSRGKSESSLKI